MKTKSEKSLVGIFGMFLLFGNLHAQKNMVQIEQMFMDGNAYPDVYIKADPVKKLDYFVKEGVLFLKENDAEKSIALVNINFAGSSIYENAVDGLTNSVKSPWELYLPSVKPKKIPGIQLTFECKEDAENALKFLKMKFENPTKDISLTDAFTTELKEVICSAASYFEPLSEKYYKNEAVNKQNIVILEGSLHASISSSSTTIEYGHFDAEASAVKAYNAIKDKINACKLDCGTFISQPFGDYDSSKKSAMGIWVISGMKGLEDKNVILYMTLMGNNLKMNIMISSDDDEDEDDW